jgi:hypothetical protein
LNGRLFYQLEVMGSNRKNSPKNLTVLCPNCYIQEMKNFSQQQNAFSRTDLSLKALFGYNLVSTTSIIINIIIQPFSP